MENNIPRGICECFQIHSLMPSFPWRVKAPHVVIASFSQISRSSKRQYCLCHNKFSCSDLENFASLSCSSPHLHFTLWQYTKCLLPTGPLKCQDRAHRSLPFHSILYLSSSNSYHPMSEQLCYLLTGFSSPLTHLYTAAIINFPIHHFD